MMLSRPFLLTVFVVLLLGSAPAQAGYNEGLAAYKKGETALAVKELMPVAQAGNAAAQVLLAQILLNGGKGVARDLNGGMQWLRRAAEGNNIDAQFFLAGVLFVGRLEQAKDIAEAAKWYERAARAGDTRAMLPFATIKVYGMDGAPAQPQAALPYIEKRLAANDIQAHRLMGMMALQGIGMEKDHARAMRHLKVVADQGDEDSAFLVGQLYVKGLGVAKNTDEGWRLIRASANAGNYAAMGVLGSMLSIGEDGLEQDSQEAFKWFTIIVNRAPRSEGFYIAAEAETRLRSRLSSRQIEAAQAEASRFVPTPMKAAAK